MNDHAITAIHPTTPAQQGFLIGSLSSPDAAYVEQTVFPLTGRLDHRQFDRACNGLVADHEILRTGFAWQLAGEPRQIVLSTGILTPEYVDGTGLSLAAQQATLQQLLARDRTPFDLNSPPLLRLTVRHLDDEHHQLIWTHHHVVLDGWSHLALARELLDRYTGGPGRSSAFGPYARWLTTADRSHSHTYWTKQLNGYRGLDNLASRTQVGFGYHAIVLHPETRHSLNQFVAAHGLTLASVIGGSWALVAARLRDRTDIAIGVTVSGRSAPFADLTELVGPVATTMPLRLTIAAECNAATWFSETHGLLLAAEQHSDCSGADLQAWSGIASGTSLYDSVVALATYPHTARADSQLSDLQLHPSGIVSIGGRTRHPLTLGVDTFDGLRLRLVNDRIRVSDADADAALNAVTRMLERLADQHTIRVGELAEEAGRLIPMHTAAPSTTNERCAANGDSATSLTQVLVSAFANVLGWPVDSSTDFLDVGGHSLLALQLLHHLRTTLRVDLTLSDLLEARTPAALARRVRQVLAGDASIPPLLVITPAESQPSTPFPLTSIQQAYWAGRRDEFDLGGVDSHLYTEVDLTGLDLERLETVWRLLIDRHAMLRAVTTTDGQQQILELVAPYEILTTDLRDREDAHRWAAIEDIRDRLSHPLRDPTRWPLFTIEAALLPEGITRLFLSFDLLIGDALSWQILYREARTLYMDLDSLLPVLELTFADYVAHDRSLRGTERYERDREYWQSKLPSLPLPPPLPLSAAGTSITHARFTRHRLKIKRCDADALRQVASAHGCTLSTLLLAVFNETLRRFTGSTQFLVNVTVYNRPPLHPQINQIVGDFTSTVLVDVDLSAATFGERVRQLQRTLWSDLDHLLYSGVELLRELRPGRFPKAPVVFTSTLDLSAETDPLTPFPGVIGYGIGQTPQVLLDYQTYEVATDLIINLDAVDRAFPDGLVSAMLDHHAAALRLLTTDPFATQCPHLDSPRPIPTLPAPLGEDRLLHEPFVEQANRHPDRIALVHDGVRVTYRALYEQAQSLADRIIARDPDRELVGLLCRPGPGQAAAALGVLLAGYAFAPLDTTWPKARIADLLTATDVTLVITDHFTDSSSLPPGVSVLMMDADEPYPAPTQVMRRPRQPDDVAYVIFTSGSTGHPKGVAISHSGALNTILDINRTYSVSADDTVLAVSAFAFDLAIYDLFGILAAGGTIVIPTSDQRHDPRAWAHLISAEHVTVWNSVPVLMELLTDALQQDDPALRKLRLCLLSGDWISVKLPAKLREHAPRCRLVSLGGATEGSIWSIRYDIGNVDPAWTSIPYGTAMSGQTVTVMDDELRPCPAWVPGQIYIGGHGVALGYWNAPELTASSFPFDGGSGARLYQTGDWGRTRPDGVIEFLGRHDDQVKIRGHRVELREVEAALSAVAGVTNAAVVAVNDRADRRLAAFVVTERTVDEVLSELTSMLPTYMLPSSVAVLERIPISGVDKVDRAALARLATTSLDDVSRPDFDTVPGAREIRANIASSLKSTPDVDDDLVVLGLSSVDIIRLANTIESFCGRRPRLRDFYRTPTLRFLLQYLTEAQAPNLLEESVQRGPQQLPSAWDIAELTDPEERQRFRAKTVSYPPAPLTRTLPRTESLAPRAHTPRRFTGQAVTAEQLSSLLVVLARSGIPNRFQYPSAGGLYAVQTYVHVRPGRVKQVNAGLYSFHPDAADLVINVPDIDLDENIHLGPTNRPVVRTAAFTVFLTTKPSASAPLYGGDAEALALLNAGYIGQLLCSRAASLGLGICPLHGIDFDAVRWTIPNGSSTVLLHTLAGGIPDVSGSTPT